LKGDEIHIYSRIVCLADVFDALLHKRIYKQAWSVEETMDYITKKSGQQFDPYLVKLLTNHLDGFVAISKL
jgi:putative two-component system response regulator